MSGEPGHAMSFEDTLAARGVPRDARTELPLDVTITSVLLAVTRSSAAASPLHASLPRVSLSFPPEGAASATVPPDGDELEVISLLGRGGMGSVYLARERSLDREVAIKTTHAEGTLEASTALCQEAVVTGHLEHPGIVPIHQLARASDGRPVLVMKRVEGTSWRALIQGADHPAWTKLRVGPSRLDRRTFHLEVLGRVSEALAFAHSRGIVHRDVKPENVLVGDFGEVYLVDWGLAVRVSEQRESATLVGTPRYMAPEMVDGRAVDPRTDVYLLGATLHEILVGAPPHAGETLQTVLLAAYESIPHTYEPDVPADLAELCGRAMARDPAGRPKDAGALRDELREHARHRASLALSDRARERLGELRARMDAPITDASLPGLYRLVAECRFAFLEAAREWPDNEAVRPGVERCLVSAIEIELSRRDPRAARALLGELERPDDALGSRVAALERELAIEAAEAQRLKKLADTVDAGAQPRARLAAGALGGLGAVSLSAYATVLDARGGLTTVDLLLFAIAAITIAGGAIFVLGRDLLRHPFNRRLVGWMLATLGALVVNRLVAAIAGSAASVVLQHDLTIMATCFGLGAIWLFRLLGIASGILLAGALAAAVYPEHALTCFTTTTAAALVVGLVAVSRARRRHTSTPSVRR